MMPILARNEEERDAVRQHIADRGIDSRTYFQPMSEQVFLKQYAYGDYPRSMELATRGFYVPLYPKLNLEEIDYIIEALNSF